MIFKKKNILLVTSAFYPEISPRSFRATELAKEFSRQGHAVTVLTRKRNFDYSVFLDSNGIVLKFWSEQKFPTLRGFARNPLRLLSTIVNRFLFTYLEYPAIEEMFKVKKVLKKERGYDMMISFAVPYPVHWGVAWARDQKNNIADTWIADCGDPYMGNVLDTFRKPFYFKYLEKWFCRKSDFITIPVESALPAYYPDFHHKIKVIPQGFDFSLTKNDTEEKINGVPTFAYSGGFIKGHRDPNHLLSILDQLTIPFKFYVFTNMPEYFDDYKEKFGDKLIISDYIERDMLLKRLSNMDFVINFDNHTPLNVPSKLIDYAIIDKPVLNVNNEIAKSDIEAFLNGNYNGRLKLPSPEYYHISRVSSLFLELL